MNAGKARNSPALNLLLRFIKYRLGVSDALKAISRNADDTESPKEGENALTTTA